MIEVKIILVPHGDEKQRKVLYKLAIANDLTGTLESGNYTYWGDDLREDRIPFLDRGEIKNYPRHKGFMELVRLVMDDISARNLRGQRDVIRMADAL